MGDAPRRQESVVETHVHEAREQVKAERASVEDHRAAMAEFADRVPPAPSSAGGPGATPAVTAAVADGGVRDTGSVREAFLETVGPHATPEGTTEAIRKELGPDVAVALAPESGAGFTPQLRRQVLAAAEERRTELSVAARALEREASSLAAAAETVDAVIDWLAAADRTPLSEVGFEGLRDRHERLEEYRERCERLLEDRQELLAATTGSGGSVGLPHRRLVASLYKGFAVEYPVLSTVPRLSRLCADCKRRVRAHLVRRA